MQQNCHLCSKANGHPGNNYAARHPSVPADPRPAQSVVSHDLQSRYGLLAPLSLGCIRHIVVQVQPTT